MDQFWNIIKYILLGLVQGVTEPLPISSSGHMIIFDSIFDNVVPFEAMNNFQIIVNTASLIAIIIYYRGFLKEILVGSFQYLFRKNKSEATKFHYLLLVLIASVPAGIVGLIIKTLEFDHYFTNIVCVAICLFITGLLLYYVHKQTPYLTRENLNWKDALFMGTGQAIGLLPGISRSGITSSFGITNGIKVETAFRFSFMMYIPASIGATFLGIFDLSKEENINVLGYIGAFLASFIGTYFAVKFFFKLLKKRNLKYFAYYCFAVSSILLILIFAGVL
ncbi:MAG: undecaprenyl-diphosphate phosphatase [Bacilli bacterium]|jgi:undecaprenyl-diphosphatase